MFVTTGLVLSALSFGVPAKAIAQDNGADLMPASVTSMDIEETHPPVRLTPDKSELIRLDRDAASVIVGNPTHLSILLDSTRLLILAPRAPGATYFTVLDSNGNVIMQRHVIVASPQEKYLRIRRSCSGSSDCQATSVYYCPDMCHEINIDNGSSNSFGNVLGNIIDASLKNAPKELGGSGDSGDSGN